MVTCRTSGVSIENKAHWDVSAFILESKEIPISFLSMNFHQSDRISVFHDKIHGVIFHLKDLFIVSFRYSSEWRIFDISDVLVGIYEFHLN